MSELTRVRKYCLATEAEVIKEAAWALDILSGIQRRKGSWIKDQFSNINYVAC